MIGEYDTRIKELCQLASQEQDSKKLEELITELNRTFEEREEWLRSDRFGKTQGLHSQTT